MARLCKAKKIQPPPVSPLPQQGLACVPFAIWDKFVPPKSQGLQRRLTWLSFLSLSSHIRSQLLSIFFEILDPEQFLPLFVGYYCSNQTRNTLDSFLEIREWEMVGHVKGPEVVREEFGTYQLVKKDKETGFELEMKWSVTKRVWRDAASWKEVVVFSPTGALEDRRKVTEMELKQAFANFKSKSVGMNVPGWKEKIGLVSLEFQRFPKLPYPTKFHKSDYHKLKEGLFRNALKQRKVLQKSIAQKCGIGRRRGLNYSSGDDVVELLSEIARGLLQKIPKELEEYNDVLLNMSCIIEEVGRRHLSQPGDLQKSLIKSITDLFPQVIPYLQ